MDAGYAEKIIMQTNVHRPKAKAKAKRAESLAADLKEVAKDNGEAKAKEKALI